MAGWPGDNSCTIRTADTSNGWVLSLSNSASAIEQHLAGEEEALEPGIPWNPPPPDATPLQVLCWRSRYPTLTGRDGAVQTLLEWARSGPGVLARILVGEAGAGKSRLAAEVAEILRQEGWTAGFTAWKNALLTDGMMLDGSIWQMGKAGGLLILDDPSDDDRYWREVARAVTAADIGPHSLRLLILRRECGFESTRLPARYSVQALDALSIADAEKVHHEMVLRHAAAVRVSVLDERFTPWALAGSSLRTQPFYVIAAALYMSNQAPDEDYPANEQQAIEGLAQATHDLLNREGRRAGLADDDAPLVVALAEARGGMDLFDLQRIAGSIVRTRFGTNLSNEERNALVAGVESFIESAKQLSAWNGVALPVCGDSLFKTEFVRRELHAALERGLGRSVDALMAPPQYFDGLTIVARLDRTIFPRPHRPGVLDENTDLRDRLARELIPFTADWTTLNLGLDANQAGSLLSRALLLAAERRVPRLPVHISYSDVDGKHFTDLVILAANQAREYGAAAAVPTMEEAVKFRRHLDTEYPEDPSRRSYKNPRWPGDVQGSLRWLANYLTEAKLSRARDVWKECVERAHESGDSEEIRQALSELGRCEYAAVEDRLAAWRELREQTPVIGQRLGQVEILWELATLAPLDEARRAVYEAEKIRASQAEDTFPSTTLLDRLFERFKDADPPLGLVFARVGVAVGRRESESLSGCLLLGRWLENLASVATTSEAREALREALDLYRTLANQSRNCRREDQDRSIDEKLVGRVEQQLREVTARV